MVITRNTPIRRRTGVVLNCIGPAMLVLLGIIVLHAVAVPKDGSILVMGLDHDIYNGAMSPEDALLRSDVMIVVEMNKEGHAVSLHQVPRDRMTYISRQIGWDKANLSVGTVGPRQTCVTLGKMVGHPIDHYMVMTIPEFTEFVQILGGIGEADTSSNTKQQEHTTRLDAYQALSFIQRRPGSDAERQGRQKSFLELLFGSVQRPGARTLQQLAVWMGKVDTDMSLLQAAQCAQFIRTGHREFQPVPTHAIYLNDISYVLCEAPPDY